MNTFINLTRYFTFINKWVVAITLALLMPLVTVFALMRSVDHPVVGDIEITQFAMVLLIMGSLAYTEKTNSHISIGIIVDRLPARIQVIFDLFAHIFTFIFCVLVCWVFISESDLSKSSDLLNISFYPFKLFIVMGFAAWGFEIIIKCYESMKQLKATE
ncbi:TRAP-type C4-dicarboxylate transport system permease small subunit [Neobacillus niacini]|uniref:TRAP transporter small permease n=1 Tax=Neobacillus niacini TaxID=86668 RepID=UPI00285A048C|nr:TRAP transporter small permease [Neobacillus niacini]MDR7079767.1 TRAP-type C4-dicarboxylate transport system permease small subunit [Neobacillus niacini]